MPRRYRRRKHRRRKRKAQSRTTVIPRSHGVLSNSLRTRLKYCETMTLSGAATSNYIFKINNLFDPNYTGTGHQPMGFDQLATFYNRYRVDAVRARITARNNHATVDALWVVAPSNDGVAFSDETDAAEQRHASPVMTVGCGDQPSKTWTKWYSCANINGVSRTKYKSDDSFSAVTTAGPTEFIALTSHLVAGDGATNLAATLTWELEFNCVFFDPKDLAQS